MSNSIFYAARADEARQAAAAATLANVRERSLRSASVWEEMASRAVRLDRHRAEEVIRRAERDEAAALAEPAPAFVGDED